MPAGQAADAVESEDGARNRRTDHARRHAAQCKERDDASAFLSRVPEGEIQDDTREKPRLRYAEQEAHHVKHRDVLHEHERHRNQSPDNHNARNPDPCADALQDQVAGHLKDEIANEKQPRPQAIDTAKHAGVHPEHFPQVQFGKTYVDPVDVRDDVAKKEQRNKPCRHLGQHSAFFCTARELSTGRRKHATAGRVVHETRGCSA